jgi:hypothetical protein
MQPCRLYVGRSPRTAADALVGLPLGFVDSSGYSVSLDQTIPARLETGKIQSKEHSHEHRHQTR